MLAIILHRLLPDLKEWQVTVHASDINPQFLEKAQAGLFSDWSFRGAPDWLRRTYFAQRPDGLYAVHPQIRRMVQFSYLNLMDVAEHAAQDELQETDVILCRNVLMYFNDTQARRLVGSLHRCLADGGWLAVSPCEAAGPLFDRFELVNYPGAILFRKTEAPRRHGGSARTSEPRPSELSARVPARVPAPPPADLCTPTAVADLAFGRTLANQGRFGEALAWCDRLLAMNKLDAVGHYLRAMILVEQGCASEARASLRHALYLDSGLVMAHFALGNLAHSGGKVLEAAKHFANAQRLLGRYLPGDILPESEGLAAGHLVATLASIAGPRES